MSRLRNPAERTVRYAALRVPSLPFRAASAILGSPRRTDVTAAYTACRGNGTRATLLVAAILCLGALFPAAARSATSNHLSPHRDSQSITASPSPALKRTVARGAAAHIGSAAFSDQSTVGLAAPTLFDPVDLRLARTASGNPPVIAYFSPWEAEVHSDVTVTGRYFTGTTAVTFNGVPAEFSVVSAEQIRAIVPWTASTGPISVTTGVGTATSDRAFKVKTFPPSITDFLPSSGPVGTSVTVTGLNFEGATAVTFNKKTATSFSVVSKTSITATVPNGATTGPLTVKTPVGTCESRSSFTVIPVPAIESITPLSGAIGSQVTILGRGLTGATKVQFNGVSGSFTVASDTKVTATVPKGASTGSLSITTPGGTGKSSSSFTVIPVPTIESITPLSGMVGSQVTITGRSLLGASRVTIGGSAALFNVTSDVMILATVPNEAVSGPVAVTTPGGATVGALEFVVVRDTGRPTVTALNAVGTRPGKSTTIRYRVDDPAPSCGEVTVWLVIKSRDGRVHYRKTLAAPKMNANLSYTFRCTIRSGKYRYYLSCRDSAGNAGTGTSSRGFRVY